MSQEAARPNLFVVGAMKAGTSSLHAYLGEHPDVFMSEPKEPCFFVDPADYDWPRIQALGLWGDEAAYLDLFAAGRGCGVRGESSTLYSKAPRMPGVPERIGRFAPGARIIYSMRDPVERTLSHYWHAVRQGAEHRDPATAIRREPHYVEVSDYASQLAPYLEIFGPDSVATLTLEELESEPRRIIAGLFAFLGVDPAFVPTGLGTRANVTPTMIARPRAGGALERLRYAPAWNAVGPLVPAPMRRLGRRLSTQRIHRTDGSDREARHYLRRALRPRVERLEELLDRTFPRWTSLDAHSRGRR